MTLSDFLNIFLGAGWLAGFAAMFRQNLRKETVQQQAELISALHIKIDCLQEVIHELSDRIKSLEVELAGKARVV